MNMELRKKLKILDTEIQKYGYCLSMYYDVIYLPNVKGCCKKSENFVEDFIRIELLINKKVKNAQGDNVYQIELTAMPCKLSGSETIDAVGALKICKYWMNMLDKITKINALDIFGTYREIVDCIEDIEKKRRQKF